MIKIRVNVSKVEKERLFKGEKGTYLDLVIYENDEPDQYGNEFSVKQDSSKEDREKGVKMPFIGNGKRIGAAKKREAPRPAQRKPDEGFSRDDDTSKEIPF